MAMGKAYNKTSSIPDIVTPKAESLKKGFTRLRCCDDDRHTFKLLRFLVSRCFLTFSALVMNGICLHNFEIKEAMRALDSDESTCFFFV
jgi:hypothetical protein